MAVPCEDVFLVAACVAEGTTVGAVVLDRAELIAVDRLATIVDVVEVAELKVVAADDAAPVKNAVNVAAAEED